MYWADELAAAASGPQVVNDSKTPSGTVHVGSLRGPVVHDAIWRALGQRGVEAHYLYGVEDLDAMDNQSLLSGDAVERYMGVPLAHVPAPAGSDEPNYARAFMKPYLATFHSLGIHPELYWMSELYAAGAMDRFVRLALDRAAIVREIYLRVSHVDKQAGWLPVQPICESCGKVGTTIALEWDGARVRYECREGLVSWARGCGHAGSIDPLGGRATLPWNLEWAAQWSHFGVTIEGCGKDLSTAGGSRDRSDAIAREVFEREPPLNVAYEFLLVGGKKMSTSKGRGAAAHEIAAVVPPEQLRFLFLRPRPNQAIEFEPAGTDAIPRLFDEFDRIAGATAGRPVKGELPADHDRIFAASIVSPDADVEAEAAAFRPAFAHLALLLQIPGVDVEERIAAEKGSALTERERAILDDRLTAARAWLETYAPDRARLVVNRESVPPQVADLSEAQKIFLRRLAGDAEQTQPSGGDAWQALIFGAANDLALPQGQAFAAIYLAFLGRTNGPRAGWLLASLDLSFAVQRLLEAAEATAEAADGVAK